MAFRTTDLSKNQIVDHLNSLHRENYVLQDRMSENNRIIVQLQDMFFGDTRKPKTNKELKLMKLQDEIDQLEQEINFYLQGLSSILYL